MGTRICPKCKKHELDRVVKQEGSLCRIFEYCFCGYEADITKEVFKKDMARIYSEGRLKQFLATLQKPGLNETVNRSRLELKEIMDANDEEIVESILIKFERLGMIKGFGAPGRSYERFIINPNF